MLRTRNYESEISRDWKVKKEKWRRRNHQSQLPSTSLDNRIYFFFFLVWLNMGRSSTLGHHEDNKSKLGSDSDGNKHSTVDREGINIIENVKVLMHRFQDIIAGRSEALNALIRTLKPRCKI